MNSKLLPGNVLFRVGTVFLSAILLWSAIEHLSNPYGFLMSVLRYAIVSGAFAEWIAMFLPALQFALAVIMLSFCAPRTSSVLATLLILLFTAVQVSAVVRELDISCGCFGSFSDSVSWWTVGRNLALLAVGIFLCLAAFGRSGNLSKEEELESICTPAI